MNLHINKNGKKGSSKGFYIALGVCLIAVGVAAWATYDSVVHYATPKNQSQSETLQSTSPTNKSVSGVYGSPESSSKPQASSVAPKSSKASRPESKTRAKSAASASGKATVGEVTTYSYPVGRTVMQKFSIDPIYCKTTLDWRSHTGIDLSAKKGEAVKAIARGKVTKAYKDEEMGNTLIISHGAVEAWYCGLDQMKVKVGDTVEAGQEIGTVGTVPIEQAEGNHLHFAIKVNGKYVDPLTILK